MIGYDGTQSVQLLMPELATVVQPIEGIEHYASVIYPIIAAGDVSGAVVMLTGEQTKIPTNAEIKLAQTAAAFLGKQMEE